jgi:hypothetical protein
MSTIKQSSLKHAFLKSPAFTINQNSALLSSVGENLVSPSVAAVVNTIEPTIKQRLMQDMKEAMKNKDKAKLAAIRSIQAVIKQKEVDDRIEVE